MNRFSLLSGVAVTACLVAVSPAASAQTARAFEIPAGPLRGALTAFAAQSDQQILFASDLVAGRISPGVSGRLEPGAALDRLLVGTGLSWIQSRPGVFALTRLRAEMTDEAATEVDSVVVTGSLLKSSGDPASPVIVLDRAALDRSGRGTVAEVLTDLPANYAGSGTPIVQMTTADRQGSNAVNATGVNLRGLGPASTLILVNGRRVAGTGFRGEFGDVSALPSSAVERVDVLTDGASAIYGSDAVAGVVNVIMRRAFDGQESRIRVSAAQGGAEDLLVSHLAGRRWSSGAAYLSVEYQTSNALSSLDRAYTRDGDLRPFGGTDHRAIYSAPGNLLVYNAAAGAYQVSYAIRPDASGTARAPTDFVAGAANLQSSSLGVDLLPNQTRQSAYGRVQQSLGDRLDLTADVRFNRRDYDFAGGANISILSVTRANPYYVSPTVAASSLIGYSFLGDLGPSKQKGASESLGLTTGATYALGRDWSLDGYFAFAQERGEVRVTNRVNSRRLNEALGVTADDPTTAFNTAVDGFFNPYGAGGANSRAILDFVGSGFTGSRDESRATSANLMASGPLFSLPGGAAELAAGVQIRRETFDTRITAFTSTAAPVTTVTPRAERTIRAVFAELRLPLVGPDNGRPGVRRLEVSVAGRFEDYDDFGSTTNPKVGLVWAPNADLTLRASWGTSFRAASLPQTHDAETNTITFLPRADGSRALALYLYGGNPDLKPETAETVTAGFDYRRPGGMTLSATVFDTRFTDRIAQPATENLNGALSDPALAPFVTLISPGTNAADLALIQSYIDQPGFAYAGLYPASTYGAIVDGRWVNTGEVHVQGLDLSARYPLTVGPHAFSLDGSASWMLTYDSQTTPAAAVRDVVDLVGYPVRLRWRLGGAWSRGPWGADLHWNHVSDYRDRLGTRIAAWNTLDLQASLRPDSGALAGTTLLLSVQNLTDEDPPFYDAPTGFGFDPGQASLLGQTVALQLIKRW